MNCSPLVARRWGDGNSCGKESVRGNESKEEMAWEPPCPEPSRQRYTKRLKAPLIMV